MESDPPPSLQFTRNPSAESNSSRISLQEEEARLLKQFSKTSLAMSSDSPPKRQFRRFPSSGSTSSLMSARDEENRLKKQFSKSSIGLSSSNLTSEGSEKYEKSEEQREWLLGIVADSLLFAQITEKQSENIVSYFHSQTVAPGEDLIKEGETADKFYVIEKGTLDVYIKGKKVNKMYAGNSIGALGIVKEGPRTATCRATEECSVWVCSKKDIFRIIGKKDDTKARKSEKSRIHRKRMRRKKKMIEKTQEELQWLISVLNSHKLFDNLVAQQKVTVAESMYLEKLDVGDVLIKQGKIDTSFYIVASGVFDILVDGESVSEEGMVRGMSLGTLAVMDKGPRSATCAARTAATVWTLDRRIWRRLRLTDNQKRPLKASKQENSLQNLPELPIQ